MKDKSGESGEFDKRSKQGEMPKPIGKEKEPAKSETKHKNKDEIVGGAK